ncbi:MAG TPA: carbohydrate kinase family protein, partial [Allocoleopsis sp.]
DFKLDSKLDSRDTAKHSSNHYDIITMGSATVDVFAHTDPSESEIVIRHHQKDIAYPLGAKILIDELHVFVGGGGTNTAVAFSRMGLKTAYLGKIGKDDNGRTISDCLFHEKVDFIGSYGEISGYSVILDSVGDDRTIFTYKGCNDQLLISEVKFEKISCNWIYLSSMMKDSFDTQKKVAEYASKKNIKIAYNPSLYICKNGSRHASLILKKTEILILNKEEVQALTQISSDNFYTLLYETSKLGPKIVVITDGKNGAHCYSTYDQTVYSASPKPVKTQETTGAGDAFASAFVAGIMLGKNIKTSLKMGMLNAESVIQHLGAKNILLNHEIIHKAELDNRQIIEKKL